MRQQALRKYIGRIIFETDTKEGKIFDVVLLVAIIASFVVTIIATVKEIKVEYATAIKTAEWFFTILFTIEYFTRIATATKPLRYIFSFYGLVDLLSIIPTYLGIFISGTQTLTAIRTLRLIRVFKVFNLYQYTNSGKILIQALQASKAKIVVFLVSVLTIVTVIGSLMYFIEGVEHGFTSIPRSIYWTIVTITTVGYGDIAPETTLGQTIASILMILGYAILAVPTGVVSAELTKLNKTISQNEDKKPLSSTCNQCSQKVTPKNVESYWK
ncbi:MAG: ion transporter [Thermonemataceae bacterium]